MMICPFCGSADTFVRNFSTDKGEGCAVECGSCEATGPIAYVVRRKQSAAGLANKNWNTRLRPMKKPKRAATPGSL